MNIGWPNDANKSMMIYYINTMPAYDPAIFTLYTILKQLIQ
jgi:hypothetical protein